MNKGMSGSIRVPNNFDNHTNEQFDKSLTESYNKCADSIAYPYEQCKKKIYFAGPWFDKRSDKMYDCCKNIFKMFNKSYEVYFPREEVNKTPMEAFMKNVNNIKDCDILIALVSKKDTGTAWEIGMAYSLNKKIYLLGYDETSFISHTNVMLAFTGKCFTLNKLGKFLTNTITQNDFIAIENDWEGIE